MRRFIALALVAIAVPSSVLASGLTVPVDQSRRLPISGSAANVVVGNTLIADVRAVDSHTLMIVGKKQGVTNVVVMDLAGRTLFDGEVVVSAGPGAMMTVYRGAEATEYACAPYCQSTASGSTALPQQPTASPTAAAAAKAVETVVTAATAPQ
jgi:hypothetical protein